MPRAFCGAAWLHHGVMPIGLPLVVVAQSRILGSGAAVVHRYARASSVAASSAVAGSACPLRVNQPARRLSFSR